MNEEIHVEIDGLQSLINHLNEAFSEDKVNVEHIQMLMENYKSESVDWHEYAKFDPHKYTRNLVSLGNGKYNLMILCWNESQGSSIHDHSNSHCFMKVLNGSVKESLFSWPETKKSQLKLLEEKEYNVNEVAYINDSVGIHQVENPSHTDGAVTLHLYCPPFDSCASFDENSGKKRQVQVTFWSKFGERCNKQDTSK